MPTIEAKILRVYQDEREWYHVETDHPTVNDLRTKQEAKAREARSWADSGEVLVIDAKHQQRPREGGGVWDNYYYESARIAQRSSNGGERSGEIERVTNVPAPGTSDRMKYRDPTHPDEQWHIALSVGVKMVGDELPVGHLTDLSWQGLNQRALGWATFVYATPKPNPSSQSSAPGAYNNPDEFANSPLDEDEEDIPF